MRFDVFTLFPAIFDSPLKESILKRAIDAGLLEVYLHNIRDYTTDKHHITDDYPYGGGGGMVMKPEPVFTAVEFVLGIRDQGSEIGIRNQHPARSIQQSRLSCSLRRAGRLIKRWRGSCRSSIGSP